MSPPHLYTHLGPVLVAREADAEAGRALVEADVDERAAEPAVLALDLARRVAVVVLLLAVVRRPRTVRRRIAVDGQAGAQVNTQLELWVQIWD